VWSNPGETLGAQKHGKLWGAPTPTLDISMPHVAIEKIEESPVP